MIKLDKRLALSYSLYTNPGEFIQLFENLSDSLPELCRLIKAQLIHPVARYRYDKLLPETRQKEDYIFSTVHDILRGLISRNPDGLIESRPPQERLILSCRYHALLLASILKYKNVPSRLRAGFADYLVAGKKIDHWVCEVWDSDRDKWKLVDSDIFLSQFILQIDFDPCDVPRRKFITAGKAWEMVRNDNANPDDFGIDSWWGISYIIDQIVRDLECIRNNERVYWDLPEFFHNPIDIWRDEEFDRFDKYSIWLEEPDSNFGNILSIVWNKI